ncbi:MAG: hypothetical protein ACKO55_12085, partial [Bacteroidota bacterium]
DYQENRWTWGAGMRMERYVTNGLESLTLPQIRTSLNYHLFAPSTSTDTMAVEIMPLRVDLRLGWTGQQGRYRFNFIVRNALNRSWMPVPGNIGEQRNFQVQWTVQL